MRLRCLSDRHSGSNMVSLHSFSLHGLRCLFLVCSILFHSSLLIFPGNTSRLSVTPQDARLRWRYTIFLSRLEASEDFDTRALPSFFIFLFFLTFLVCKCSETRRDFIFFFLWFTNTRRQEEREKQSFFLFFSFLSRTADAATQQTHREKLNLSFTLSFSQHADFWVSRKPDGSRSKELGELCDVSLICLKLRNDFTLFFYPFRSQTLYDTSFWGSGFFSASFCYTRRIGLLSKDSLYSEFEVRSEATVSHFFTLLRTREVVWGLRCSTMVLFY